VARVVAPGRKERMGQLPLPHLASNETELWEPRHGTDVVSPFLRNDPGNQREWVQK